MTDQSDPMFDSPSYLMFEMVRLVRRTSARMLPGQPRLPQLLVLWCVARGGPLSQRAVAERLRMDPGDLVGIVDALEKEGYLERRRDPGDRRRYALEVTGDGRRFLDAALEARIRLNEALFSPLSPQERALFKEMMLRVLAHHDDRFAGPDGEAGRDCGRGAAPGQDANAGTRAAARDRASS
ncbi:MarR family transcriptional regulator [Spirillospora sp. NPDC048832]